MLAKIPAIFHLGFFLCLIADISNAQDDCPNENKKHVLIEYDQTRVDVSQTCWHLESYSVPQKQLTVEIERHGKKKEWKFQGSSIAVEGWDAISGPVVVDGQHLFIQQYSGGASCCWSMLTFDLERVKYLSESASSQNTIDYDYRTHYGDSTCYMGIWATPITPPDERPLAERVQYCFNGKRFVPAKFKQQ